MDIQEQIQDGWSKGLTPLVNGVLFSDGFFTSFDIRNQTEGLIVIKKGSFLIQSIEEFVEVDITSTMTYGVNEIGCGASSMGDEGFIYNSEKRTLLWVAFFQGSNPFVKIETENGLAIVTNNWGYRLQFHPSNPLTLEVMRSPTED